MTESHATTPLLTPYSRGLATPEGDTEHQTSALPLKTKENTRTGIEALREDNEVIDLEDTSEEEDM